MTKTVRHIEGILVFYDVLKRQAIKIGEITQCICKDINSTGRYPGTPFRHLPIHLDRRVLDQRIEKVRGHPLIYVPIA